MDSGIKLQYLVAAEVRDNSISRAITTVTNKSLPCHNIQAGMLRDRQNFKGILTQARAVQQITGLRQQKASAEAVQRSHKLFNCYVFDFQ
jgi:hypothetical protein